MTRMIESRKSRKKRDLFVFEPASMEANERL